MLKRRRILIVVKSIDGGTGTFVLNFLKLKDDGFNIKTLVLEKPSFRSSVKFNAKFYAKKDFHPQFYGLILQNIVHFLSEIRWVKRQIDKFDPQVILAVDIRSNLIVLICKIIKLGRMKVVATTHIDLSRTLFNKSTRFVSFLLKFLVKSFYNSADVLIGVSKEVSNNLKNDFAIKKKIVTIYNGVQLIKTSKKIPTIKYGIIITIARLDEQKDIENLIIAFSNIQKKYLSLKLYILGDGPKRTELELLVKNLGLNKKVRFVGWVKDIKPYIIKSSVFVLSSKREGLPYVLLEAMSQGIPIVSTNTPYGPKEILDSGRYGILVPMGRPDIMAKSIVVLLTNQKKYNYFSIKSLERSNYFSVDEMLKKYKKVFASFY